MTTVRDSLNAASYECLVYGLGGGVMAEYVVEASSADVAAEREASAWKFNAQAKTVACWATDRSSHAQARVRP